MIKLTWVVAWAAAAQQLGPEWDLMEAQVGVEEAGASPPLHYRAFITTFNT